MILLLGGTGYVGTTFRRELERRQLPYRNVSRSEINYTDSLTLEGLIKETRPDFLINCAGYTGKPNVDACELYKTDCLAGNAVLPGTIREVCESANLPWGHVSSGCIFTGKQPDGSGFTEKDPPNFSFRTNNCSWYSGCKALGEETLAGAGSVFIWRLRIPFDHHDNARNYLSKVQRYARLLDAENSISHLDDFVNACLDCWMHRVPFGTYNVTNTGSVSTRDVVRLIQEHLKLEREFHFFDSEEEFMQVAAKTPRSNCVMDNSKLLSAGISIRDVEAAIVESLKNWQPETRDKNDR